jgi:hypothetical protein
MRVSAETATAASVEAAIIAAFAVVLRRYGARE